MKDPSKINVLVACEESQRVCMAFRGRGFNAYSCDIQQCSGGHPEYHILGDAVKALDAGEITTMDGQMHHISKWDLLIAHPPCTYLSNVATRAFSLRCTPPEKVHANDGVCRTKVFAIALRSRIDIHRRRRALRIQRRLRLRNGTGYRSRKEQKRMNRTVSESESVACKR